MSRNVNIVAGTLLALSAAFAVPAAAQTIRPRPPLPRTAGSPLTLDVAGVRLGMPLAAAQAALAGTYRCRAMRAPSFRQMVDREVAKRRGVPEGFGPDGKAVQQLHCEGPAGEGLRLDMAQTEAGEIVDRFHLTVPTDRVDVTTLVRQVEAKFGRPTEGTPGNGSWCRARCASVSGTDPKIWTMSAASFFSILGDRGGDARRADEAAVKAVAAREAPAAKQGAF